MPTFILNDETEINTYGFRVPNKGGDFSRFDKNPAMLNSHVNSTETVLGNWQNRRIDGVYLKGDTNFDSERPTVKEVEGQVTRGFVKGASMGITFSWDAMRQAPDGVWELEKWQLLEASICAVPSNGNALALYTPEGELIPEGEIKLAMQKLSAGNLITPNNPKMEKIILSTDAKSALMNLGVANSEDAVSISNAIVSLNASLTDEKKKVSDLEKVKNDLQAKLDGQVKLQAEALVDQAILEQKLTAGEKAEYVEAATANYALTAKLIGKMAGKKSLKAGVVQDNETEDGVKTKEDFYKLSAGKQLEFKETSPAEYQALFAKK